MAKDDKDDNTTGARRNPTQQQGQHKSKARRTDKQTKKRKERKGWKQAQRVQ